MKSEFVNLSYYDKEPLILHELKDIFEQTHTRIYFFKVRLSFSPWGRNNFFQEHMLSRNHLKSRYLEISLVIFLPKQYKNSYVYTYIP